MTDAISKLDPIIHAADAAFADFAQVEREAADARKLATDIVESEATQHKRGVQNFWQTELRDADNYTIEWEETELQQARAFNAEARDVLYGKMKPSGAVEGWELRRETRDTITDVIRDARRAVYDALYAWQTANVLRQRMVQGIGFAVGVVVLLFGVGGVIQRQEAERQQVAQSLARIIGGGEIVINSEDGLYPILAATVLTWKNDQPRLPYSCSYLTITNEFRHYYCVNPHNGNMLLDTVFKQITPATLNEANARVLAVSPDGKSWVVRESGVLILKMPFGKINLNAYDYIFAWSPDSTQFGYVGNDGVNWYKDGKLIGTNNKYGIDDLVFTTDGKRLAVLINERLYFLTPEDGKIAETFPVSITEKVRIDAKFALSPNAEHIIYVDQSGYPSIMEIATGNMLKFPHKLDNVIVSDIVWAAPPQ
jgi:hypothetical protein